MAKSKSNPLKCKGFWVAAATVALVAGLGVGVVVGYGELSRVSGDFRALQGPLVVRFNWPVDATTPPNPDGSRRSWLPLKVQQELATVAEQRLTARVTDGDCLAETARALTETGWFESIESVGRGDGNTVDVIGRWRAPVAVVRVTGPAGQVDRLISAKGELLPIVYPAGSTALRFITGPSQPAPQRYGARWEGSDVQAALALLAYLYTGAPTVYAQVLGVDASGYAPGKKLVLVTDSGAKVVWGESPDQWAPSEPSPDQKIKWLAYLRNGPEFGRRIDAGRQLVDVTSPRGIMVDRAELAGRAPESHDEPARGPQSRAGFAQPADPADRRRADRR
ncbi:MAG: hypothetical protein K2Q09_03595 [Phycisphaerales bacterium]|nr:hypothetical protein [Phycisphaerales bacterium]